MKRAAVPFCVLVNPKYNRNTYADEAVRKTKFTAIMNLADYPETFVSNPRVYAAYASQQHFIALSMDIGVEADGFRQKPAQGLRYFRSNRVSIPSVVRIPGGRLRDTFCRTKMDHLPRPPGSCVCIELCDPIAVS